MTRLAPSLALLSLALLLVLGGDLVAQELSGSGSQPPAAPSSATPQAEEEPDDFIAEIFGVPAGNESPPPDLWQAASRLVLAALLGWAVAGFYAFSARVRPAALDLGGTLILLAMLITMVTMAVGQNAAVAFTLVGTLAIVRFRTTVRDIRDTAFVIFSVAVGLAIGAANPPVAVIGTVLVGIVSMLITQFGDKPSSPRAAGGRLTLRMDGPGPHDAVIDPLLGAAARSFGVIEARIDRDGNARLAYKIDCDQAAAGGLVASLNALSVVQRVNVTFVAE